MKAQDWYTHAGVVLLDSVPISYIERAVMTPRPDCPRFGPGRSLTGGISVKLLILTLGSCETESCNNEQSRRLH